MSRERGNFRRDQRSLPQAFIPLTLQERLSQTYRGTGSTPDVFGRKPATSAEVQRSIRRNQR